MLIPVELSLSTILAVLSAFVAIKISVAKSDVRINALETQVAKHDSDLETALIAIAKRNEEMRDIHRRLNKIDDLKLEANLAEIKTELHHIRTLLEGRVGK